MTNVRLFSFVLLCTCTSLRAENAKPFDAASAFGARESATSLTLSPNGTSVAYIVPAEGQGSVAYTVDLTKGSVPKPAFHIDGKSWRLSGCDWAANDRLVCSLYGLVKDPTYGMMSSTRLVAINVDGTNAKDLSTRSNAHTRGYNLYGGDVIDWLPEEGGAVLMTRSYLPDDHLGTRMASSAEGLGVDWIDTRTLAVKHIEPPRAEAVGYLTDGHGTVRIMSTQTLRGQENTGLITHLYRLPGSREWQTLATYNEHDYSGFDIQAVDRDLNVAYGFKKKDGRKALYAISLDEGRREELVYARSDVDVDDLIRVGRRQRVVGVSYALETRRPEYLAPQVKSLMTSLAKALPPSTALNVTDASVDESKMLIFGGSDTVPGVYYLFDRSSHHLDTLLVSRSQLEGVTLAAVKPIKYPATDGSLVPGYLTLPPGHESAKGLPAIVLPHGGPSARDVLGFNWLVQFYAARGFAVLQPNYRGSSGYGDQWFMQNGFRSWPAAIGDVLDAGRWLVHEGIADPNKLAIVGWSYGGYAALQSAVVDPSVFKAVIAIAPVTDLTALKEEHRNWSDFDLISEYVGSGSHTHDGSPLEHADKIKAPVLLFHGALDRNVSIEQSKHMAARLTKAGDKCELVTWDDLDHHLDDSRARADMLRKSDEFLRQTLGL